MEDAAPVVDALAWERHRTVVVYGPVSNVVHLPAQGGRPGVLVAPDPEAALAFLESWVTAE